jgi:hypothetical protein
MHGSQGIYHMKYCSRATTTASKAELVTRVGSTNWQGMSGSVRQDGNDTAKRGREQ